MTRATTEAVALVEHLRDAARDLRPAVAIYVPMPVDAYGQGPASVADIHHTEHQIWDAETNGTLATAKDEAVARHIVKALNALAQPGSDGELREATGRVQRRIEAGLSLRDTLKSEGAHLEAQTVENLVASLRSSNTLNSVLHRNLQQALASTPAIREVSGEK